MTRTDDENEEQVWRTLSDAGLVEIRLGDFAQRIRDVKSIVILRLRELLDFNTGIAERESAAYSLGALKRLELKVAANSPKAPDESKS